MPNAYTEHLIKRKTPPYLYVLNAVLVIITAICIYLALTTNVLAVALMFIVGGLTYFGIRNSRVEYEYIFVEDQLTIDKILGKAKRKKVWRGSMPDVVAVALTGSDKEKEALSQGIQTIDCTSHMPDAAQMYTIVTEHAGKRQRILIEPSDKLLQNLWQKAPSRVFWQK